MNMNTESVLERLSVNPPEHFCYCTVEANDVYKDINGKPLRVDYDCDILKIEFVKDSQGKYKPTIMLWSNGGVSVLIHVVGYGDFCFPVTGKNEHYEERLKSYFWFKKFVENGGDEVELLRICDWIEKACIS